MQSKPAPQARIEKPYFRLEETRGAALQWTCLAPDISSLLSTPAVEIGLLSERGNPGHCGDSKPAKGAQNQSRVTPLEQRIMGRRIMSHGFMSERFGAEGRQGGGWVVAKATVRCGRLHINLPPQAICEEWGIGHRPMLPRRHTNTALTRTTKPQGQERIGLDNNHSPCMSKQTSSCNGSKQVQCRALSKPHSPTP